MPANFATFPNHEQINHITSLALRQQKTAQISLIFLMGNMGSSICAGIPKGFTNELILITQHENSLKSFIEISDIGKMIIFVVHFRVSK